MEGERRRKRQLFAHATLVAGVLASWCPSAFALNPALDVSQYAHTAWRSREGFVEGIITAIAQTPDGYLWLGTDTGLSRFDGIRRVAWQPPSDQRLPSDTITGLLVTRDGALWISTDKGVVRWKGGKLSHYAATTGHRTGKLVEDRDGTVWLSMVAGRDRTLCEIRSERVHCHGEDGGAGAGVIGLYEDRRGTLWAGTMNGVWRWQPGEPTFYPQPPQPNGIQGFAEDDDGTLLISELGGLTRFVDGKTEVVHPVPHSLQQFEFNKLLRDRDGGLWLGSISAGLVHLHNGKADLFAASDGLSGDAVTTLFEDREGNVWVATREGLDRFHNIAVATVTPKQGLANSNVQSLHAAPDGSVWLATGDGLNRWRDGRMTVYRTDQRPADPVMSVFQDRIGRVWVSTRSGVGYLDDDRFVRVNGLPAGPTRGFVEDSRYVWFANQNRGLFRVSLGGEPIQETPWAALQHQDFPTAVAAESTQTGIWIGFLDGGVVHVANGRASASFGSRQGLPDATVRHLRVDPDGTLWAATDAGVSRIKDGHIWTFNSRNGLPCDAAQWLVEDDTRSLWVGMRCGLVRIARAEIERFVAATDKGAAGIRTLVLDSTDGFRTYFGTFVGQPAVKARDGTLWFLSSTGVSVVDPQRLPVNDLPPPVQIEAITADRTAYDASAEAHGTVRLPPLVRDLQVDYTALSFVTPEKNRFRYKLEGYDREWQDAGNRRQAFYTNLPPRTYRLRVIASNNSGVWNETGASLEFSIAPAFFQTSWFLALSVATVVALVWSAHRVRLRIVEKHEHEISALNERLMKAQEQERIRIAGELHDGVMQEMLAATMMLGAVKRRIPDESEARTKIEKVQDKLIHVGTDIRRLSHDLHPPVLQEAGLPQALQICCEEFGAASGITVYCEADDRARELSRGAALALFRIVQEALGNAAKHARATRITVRLTRSDDKVFLAIADDGVGFDGRRLDAPGGLGLVMMRERASQLTGTFEFDSTPGKGTTIRVVIPFR